MKRRIFVPGLILALALVSMSFKCDNGGNGNTTSDPLRKYAKALDDMAGALNALTKAKRSLGEQSRITPAEELNLTNKLKTANDATTIAFNRVKALSTIDPASRTELRTLFDAISAAMGDLNSSGILGLSNTESRSKLSKIFAGVTTALAVLSTLQS